MTTLRDSCAGSGQLCTRKCRDWMLEHFAEMTMSQNKKYRILSTHYEMPADALKGICGSWSQLSMRGLHCLNIQMKLVRPSVGVLPSTAEKCKADGLAAVSHQI